MGPEPDPKGEGRALKGRPKGSSLEGLGNIFEGISLADGIQLLPAVGASLIHRFLKEVPEAEESINLSYLCTIAGRISPRSIAPCNHVGSWRPEHKDSIVNIER